MSYLIYIIFLAHVWEKWLIGETCYCTDLYVHCECDKVVDDRLINPTKDKTQTKTKQAAGKKNLKKYEEPKENWDIFDTKIENKRKEQRISFSQ